MDLDILWKAIVPLTFLAIWALTALFNRDVKPLPSRIQAPVNPYALKPTPPPPRPAPTERTPAIRWASQVNTSLRPGGGLDDDIVILDPPRTIRPLQTKGVAPARRTKAKPAAVSSSTHQSYPAREGLAGVSQTVNQQITKTLKLQPLSETSVATPVQSVTAATSIDVGDVKGGLAGVAASFNDPKRLREAIIVSVILQPPVSLRGRNRRI